MANPHLDERGLPRVLDDCPERVGDAVEVLGMDELGGRAPDQLGALPAQEVVDVLADPGDPTVPVHDLRRGGRVLDDRPQALLARLESLRRLDPPPGVAQVDHEPGAVVVLEQAGGDLHRLPGAVVVADPHGDGLGVHAHAEGV